MAYYDDETNILKDFRECRDEDLCPLDKKTTELLQRIQDEEAWHHSNRKSDPPPDFYSDKYTLMMEVMRVDDHAFINDKGGVINPHIQKENKTYKDIQDFLKKQGVHFSGDIIVNAPTNLSTEDDHSYDKYVANFRRVLEKHDSNYDLYTSNHEGYKLAYFILDESSPYMQVSSPDDKIAVVGKAVEARLHLPFLDKAFIDTLAASKADYFVWYMPYKHFKSKEMVRLPQAVIYSKDILGAITIQEYDRKLLSSIEI